MESVTLVVPFVANLPAGQLIGDTRTQISIENVSSAPGWKEIGSEVSPQKLPTSLWLPG